MNGKIVDTRTGEVFDLADPSLVPAIFPCGAITLLGEVHDNAEHHRMRAGLLQAEADAGGEMRHNCSSMAFVFEHLSEDQKSSLERFYSSPGVGIHGPERLIGFLLRSLDWENLGWPQTSTFRLLFHQAIRRPGRRTIIPGNPSREMTRSVAKQGLAAVDREVARQLRLDQALDAPLFDALLTELEASHCGFMPKKSFGNMADAQRLRDAHMADVAMMTSSQFGSAVLFAGNGHVRADRGIPWYIRKRAPDRTVITVAFVETEYGKTDPAAYGPHDPEGRPATDYVAFAMPTQREDPCEGMRKAVKK